MSLYSITILSHINCITQYVSSDFTAINQQKIKLSEFTTEKQRLNEHEFLQENYMLERRYRPHLRWVYLMTILKGNAGLNVPCGSFLTQDSL